MAEALSAAAADRIGVDGWTAAEIHRAVVDGLTEGKPTPETNRWGSVRHATRPAEGGSRPARRVLRHNPATPRRVAEAVAVTAGKILVMSERRRGKNGAAKRYKGPRDLVGARVWPEVVDRLDEARVLVERTRNDWIAAAILVALNRPVDMAKALQQIDELDPRPSHAKQLAFTDNQEDLDRSA